MNAFAVVLVVVYLLIVFLGYVSAVCRVCICCMEAQGVGWSSNGPQPPDAPL